MSKYMLLVQRKKEYKNVNTPGSDKIEDSTISNVRLIKEKTDTQEEQVLFKCYCCENIGPSTDTPKQDKRIVARDYKLRWSSSGVNGGLKKYHPDWAANSERGKKLITDGTTGSNIVIWLTSPENPNFANRRIHIHIGNGPASTFGCLLFGNTDNENGTVGQSTAAIYEFFNIVEKIGIENITLSIKEIPEA